MRLAGFSFAPGGTILFGDPIELRYLEALTLRLSHGVAALREALRQPIARYIVEAQQADGGFCGREGPSDLYYTQFALRSLAVLGHLGDRPAAGAARFLASRLSERRSVIDVLSLVYGALLIETASGLDVDGFGQASWRRELVDYLASLRRDDGGYAKSAVGAASSTYHTFLVLLCQQLLDVPLDDQDGLTRFVLAQRCDDGGFREIRAAKRAGTNPTAAAVGALRIVGALDAEVSLGAAEFLAGMQTDEGGLRANTRIPIADLLSTFTGAWSLADLDALHRIDGPAALRFAQSLQEPTGGFRGAAWDETPDLEYTFYGLGCLALLSPLVP